MVLILPKKNMSLAQLYFVMLTDGTQNIPLKTKMLFQKHL